MGVSMHPVNDLASLLALEQVKPDAFLGAGPVLGWGRIYGGQVVAQALRAAGLTVDEHLRPQSLHAYFVQAGDERLPVLYEVDRVRDSGSFATRQVVAYQARGAVLNLIASFHRPEPSIDIAAISAPTGVPAPESLPEQLDGSALRTPRRHAPRRAGAIRAGVDAGARTARRRSHVAGVRLRLLLRRVSARDGVVGAPGRAELGAGVHGQPRPRDLVPPAAPRGQWLLYELRGGGVADSRGLAVARVFDRDGAHVASLAQEALARDRR